MSAASGEAVNLTPAKILLVEDSVANRDMLTRRLVKKGFEVIGAVDGPTGVATSLAEIPDLILMDIALGDMDGWQATRIIKSNPKTAHIPVIALTAHALATDRDKSVEIGCADFDTKPVDFERLLGKIAACLSKKPLRSTDAAIGVAEAGIDPVDSDCGVQAETVSVDAPRGDSALRGTIDTTFALTGSMRDFRELQGANLIARVAPFFEWQNARRQRGLWPYSKATEQAPLARCTARDENGIRFSGLNFATQDYLGLSSHPEIKATAKAVIDEYGVHSAGSSALAGNTKYSLRLERAISEFLELEHTVLYPTGWAAGYGAIKGLVRPNDHIVMDGLAHACLQEGAYSATSNVHLHGHLNLDSTRRHLKKIRGKDTEAGILVVTESLFSMDSDSPDLRALQDLCREYNATLLVDVAHDLGALGETGRGFIGMQGMTGRIDIVMGSFSKTFGSNGGFVACNSEAVKQYLKFYGCSATFSNALSPVQAATVAKAFEIVRSPEGRDLRYRLMQVVVRMRDALEARGLSVIGSPSAIVPVLVGDEALARMVSRKLPEREVIANLVEYPAVAKGNARFRLQMMPSHRAEDVEALVERLCGAVDETQVEYADYLARIGKSASVAAAKAPAVAA
jgi:7-keto-8-aminopelargonate synthetase-like enzyme/ActR/RegA family two-component response regulator